MYIMVIQGHYPDLFPKLRRYVGSILLIAVLALVAIARPGSAFDNRVDLKTADNFQATKPSIMADRCGAKSGLCSYLRTNSGDRCLFVPRVIPLGDKRRATE